MKQTAGRDALGRFAPKFAELNDDILFGEVWSRESGLSHRDRSLITITSLMTSGLVDSSFKYHMETAKKNGITKTEIAEALTHLAFYSGWPKAWAAFRVAKEVWTEEEGVEGKGGIFPVGKPNDGFAQYFTGQSYLHQLNSQGAPIFNVTFEPGCRNNWHIHQAKSGGGQLLLCTNGRGWYQAWGREARELHAGDVVEIPAGVKHWHGAAKDSWFSHLAVEAAGEETENEWCEAVADEAYNQLP